MKKILILALVFALVITMGLFYIAGCNKKNDDGVIKLLEVTHSVFYAPLYVAINKGYFADEGLIIELTNAGGSDKVMTGLMSGQAQIGLLGPETAVYVALGGSSDHPVVFCQLTKKDGSFIIGRRPEPNFVWADLAGHEIIGGRPGGMPAMSLEHAIKKNNLQDSVTINYGVQFDLITAAFEGGTGDYCTMFEPAASDYQTAGKGYIIASVGAEAGEMPYTTFMAKKDYINGHSGTVKAFMRAIIKAIDYVMTSNSDDVAASLAPSFPGTSLATLSNAVTSYKTIGAYKETPVMSEAEFNNLLSVLTESGTITSTVPYTEIIDNSIAQSLL
jgi:ABC-type nitrate/sulfonate/bicarbonate transport systems, periplasmic components